MTHPKIAKSIKPVWTTEDGKVHDSEEEADIHQAGLDFAKWYENHPLYGQDCRQVELEELLPWLSANRREIRKQLVRLS